jgi:tetratricopeptide (TPR) repeat protein
VLINDGCKVVDFGLARQFKADVNATDTTTQPYVGGSIEGTVPYMAPERLAGDAGGSAEDVFALGAVLYEMLSGQRAFDGPTNATVMGAILHGQPQWSVLKGNVPAKLRRLIQDCLAKKSSERPSADEVARRLAAIGRGGGRNVAAVPDQRSRALSLGVMPFGGVDQQASAAALDVFVPELLRLGSLRIVRATDAAPALDDDSSLELLARRLRVNLLMTGVIDRAADHTVFRIRVVDPVAHRQVYATTCVQREPNYVECAHSAARAIVPELSRLLSRPARPVRRHRGSSRAQELYIEGRYHWNKRTRQGNDTALQLFAEAIEQDCLWALPHAGVADCHTTSAVAGWGDAATNYQRAKVAAYTAIELDRTVAEPHATLGNVYSIADWNWRAAEGEFKTALYLNPGYVESYMWYGKHLGLRGRHSDAMENYNVAWKLDPLSRAVSLSIGIAWYVARRFEIARGHFETLIAENPSWCNALYFAGLANLFLGRMEQAIVILKRAVESDQTTRRPLIGLAQAYWLAGERQSAEIVFGELVSSDSPRYLSPCDAAEVRAVFGDEQGCIEWLRRAVDERCADLAGLRTDPMYDGIRDNVEFKQIESLVFGDA